jgi:hypothetical protein
VLIAERAFEKYLKQEVIFGSSIVLLYILSLLCEYSSSLFLTVYLAASCARLAYLFQAALKYFTPRMTLSYRIKDSLGFSIPLSIHNLGLWAVRSAGPWVGIGLVTRSELQVLLLVDLILSYLATIIDATYKTKISAINTLFASGSVKEGAKLVCKLGLLTAVIGLFATNIGLGALGLYLSSSGKPDLSIDLILYANCMTLFHISYMGGSKLLYSMKRITLQMKCTAANLLLIPFIYGSLLSEHMVSLLVCISLGYFSQALLTVFGAVFALRRYDARCAKLP